MAEQIQGDWEAAGAVYAASWRASHSAFVGPDGLARYTPDYGARFLAGQAAQGREVYVDSLKAPRGVLVLHRPAREVGSLYVEPRHWGQGVGHCLLCFALGTLGPGPLTLTVMNVNTRARRFYEAHGFAYTGQENVLSSQRGLSELLYEYRGRP